MGRRLGIAADGQDDAGAPEGACESREERPDTTDRAASDAGRDYGNYCEHGRHSGAGDTDCQSPAPDRP